MTRRVWSAFWAGLLALSLLGPAHVVRGEPDGIVLVWEAGPPELTPDDAGALIARVPGYALTDGPGQPRLPFASALVALPPGAQPSLEVLESTQSTRVLDAPLALAPQPAGILHDEAGDVVGGAFEPLAPERALPATPVVLTPLGMMRGVSLARVTFYPVLPAGDGLLITTHLRAAVRVNTPERVASATSAPDDPLLEAVRAAVVNPDAVQTLAFGSQTSAINLQAAASISAPSALVEVDAPGLTAITYAALAAAAFPVGAVDPAYLRLQLSGADVAMEWDGDPDAQFEPGERLLFYAAPRLNRYTARDVYRLFVDAGPAPRMAARPALSGAGAPAVAWAEMTWERNTIYTAPSCKCAPGRDGDRWMWDYLSRPGAAVRSYPLTLPPLDRTQPATLTVWLLGFTKAAHHVDVALNGAPIGAVEWSNQLSVTATLPVAAGLLAAGANTLTLSLLGTDGLWLDAFSVQYAANLTAPGAGLSFESAPRPRANVPVGIAPAAQVYLPLITMNHNPLSVYTVHLAGTGVAHGYDVTDEAQPLRIADLVVSGDSAMFSIRTDGVRRYALMADSEIRVPAAVRAPHALSGATGADYLIISHPDFIPALGPLVALRQAQGLAVAVEDVRAVYDTAGDGRPVPEAIRDFLAHVYATWSPRPQYVLLVGDGTYDPRRYRSDSQATFIPPYLADVDPWLGETAADNRFVAVDGPDALPDFALGRLPVNTLAETQTIVDKIVQYETAPPAGAWNGQAAFAADDADGAGDFAQAADAQAALITPSRTVQRIYFTPSASITDTRQLILSQWNAGAGLVVYNGHSSQRQWGAERFFHKDDVSSLANAGRLPVVLEMTCLTGSFQDAALSTLDESLLRQAGGGAVGVWGPTGLGVATGHGALGEAFLQRVYQAGQPNVGAAALAGKLAVAASGQNLDLIETFVWLGDPATSIALALNP